jgi:hypothetical protein
VADMGAEVSGYYADSNYHIFASGHEQVLMPGAADDWMYDHFGVLSFTVEIWNLPKHAGARGYAELGMRRMMQLTDEEVVEDQRKIYAWVSREVPQDGVFDWRAVDHPDFGVVEVGGLNPKFVRQNPPRHLLEEECAHVSAFLTRLGLSTPTLLFTHLQATPTGPNLYRVVAEVANGGYLPTSSTHKGRTLLLEGLTAEIEGATEIIAGVSPSPLGHLDGYGGQSVWSPPKGQRAHVEWVIAAKAGTTITVVVRGARAGKVSQSLTLEAN